MRRILAALGTRPNFVRMVRLRELFEWAGFGYRPLHTGWHFDYRMSEVFFRQVGRLGGYGATHGGDGR